jgi:hypothetical protein
MELESLINGNLITFIGYFTITLAYLIFVFTNIKRGEPYIIVGSVMIFIGYLLLAKDYFEVVMDEMEIKLWKGEETTNENGSLLNVADTFTGGHFILFAFFLLSFFLPINEHLKDSDVIPIIGHFLLFTHQFLFFSYLLMVIYYSMYFVRNFKDTSKYVVNILQCIAAVLLIFHYFEGMVSHSLFL